MLMVLLKSELNILWKELENISGLFYIGTQPKDLFHIKKLKVVRGRGTGEFKIKIFSLFEKRALIN